MVGRDGSFIPTPMSASKIAFFSKISSDLYHDLLEYNCCEISSLF
jgi:hypothetical protein